MQLFKDRSLNLAILISASWHLVFMFSVTPILVSEDIRDYRTTISFLGSILEKVAAVPEKTLMQLRDISSKKIDLRQPEFISKPVRARPDKEGLVVSEDKHKSAVSGMYHKKKERRQIRFKEALVMGGAMNRTVLYKPPLPNVPILNSDFDSDYNVSIRFRISRNGFVESPERIKSSGSSDVDQMAIRYVRRWQFVPLEENVEDTQEGIIHIDFDGR